MFITIVVPKRRIDHNDEMAYKKLLMDCFGIPKDRIDLDSNCTVRCTPEQFAAFIIMRNDSNCNFTNGMKELDMKMFNDNGSRLDRYHTRVMPDLSSTYCKWDAISGHGS